MLRPFYPGGDYENEDYSDPDCVVVDNPPFSIINKICRFYVQHGIKFLLFAPTLTLFNLSRVGDIVLMPTACDVIYENGAVVPTSFVSNLEPGCMWIPTDMISALNEAVEDVKNTKKLPKYTMPDNVWSGATVSKIAAQKIGIRIPSSQYVFVRALDSQRKQGKQIYGGGLLMSDTAARVMVDARRAAEDARRAADGSTTWTLSDREREIIKGLGAD